MGLVVDNFAGGGGASSGIEAALGKHIDYAINHDPEAISMHRVNHPRTRHLTSSVWDVNPRKLCAGRPVDLAWFSPDCTYHSKARGGKPFRDRKMARRRRGLAGLIPRWMAAVHPDVVMLENVEEFADWGPLDEDGKPDPLKRGSSFRRWIKRVENLGYSVDLRELRACDYGAPTTRKRLFIIARRDGGEIIFPEATHGHGLTPFRTAADCIDWSLPCPSIFARAKPLVEATQRRIARGVMRYVVDNPRPFIVPITHTGGRSRVHGIDEPLRTITTAQRGEFALVAAFLAKHYGGVTGHGLQRPVGTVTTVDHHALVTSHLVHLRRNCDARAVDEPIRTISAQGQHFGEVRAFLMKFYGNERSGHNVCAPIGTITTKDRFGLVTVHGEPYQIVDIGMRMLSPRELYLAQGFRHDYIIDHGRDEHDAVVPLTKTAQVRMCGNSVSPKVAEALVRANVVEQREQRAA